MKCSNTQCGVVGIGQFCHECGSEMADVETLRSSLVCGGTKKDGSVCTADIGPKQKFCTHCGTKVDKSRFQDQTKNCTNCGSPVELGLSFCGECGFGQDIACNSTDENITVLNLSTGEQHSTEENESVPEVSDDEVVVTTSKNADMIECQVGTNEIANSVDVELQPSIPLKADLDSCNGIGSINVTDNTCRSMLNAVGSQISVEVDENEAIQQKTNTNNHKPDMEANESELNISTHISTKSSTMSSSCREDMNPNVTMDTLQYPHLTVDIEPNVITNDKGQLQQRCTTLIPDTRNTSVEKDHERHIETELIQTGDTSNANELQQISDQSSTAKEGSTDDSIESSTGAHSFMRKNESTHTDDDESPTVIHREEVHDDKNESATESMDELSQSDDDLPSRKTTDAAPKQTQYHGKYKRKQKHKHNKRKENKRRKLERKARRVLSKFEDNTDVNGNTSQQAISKTSMDFSDSKQSEKVFGTGKNWKNQQNAPANDSKSTQCGLFETQPTSTKSNKTDQKSVVTNKGNDQSKAGIKDSTSKQSSQSKKVRIHFHGLISDDFDFVMGAHKLIVRIRINNEWDKDSHVCTVHRHRRMDMNILEFKYSTQLPVSMERIKYKYCVLKPDGSYLWEYYTTSYERNYDRLMLNNWKDSDEWHQYDGVLRKQKGIWQNVSNFFLAPDMIDHAKLCAEYFSSDIMLREDNQSCFESVYEELKSLFFCLRKIYFYDARSWGHNDENVFVREVGFCVLKPLLKTLETSDANDGVSCNETKELKVRAAISVILLVHETGKLAIDKTSVWDSVCKALQFCPNAEQKICSELTVVNNYFPRKKKQVIEAVQNLACSIAKSTSDPSWFFLMPWIHFLSGWCSPYDDPPCDIDHDKPEPLWWGLNKQLNDAVLYFKAKSSNWTTSMEDMIRCLQPVFKADYLLSRTFLAALPLRDTSAVTCLGIIPVEVFLANVLFFIKKNGVHDEEVQLYLHTVSGIVQTDRTAYTVPQRKLQCLISSQLVNECNKWNQDAVFVCAIHTLLHCLSQYDSLSADSADNRREFVMGILQEQGDNAVKWIKYKKPFCITESSHFKVWNSLFLGSDCSSENVMNAWNNQIAKTLKDRLFVFYQEFNFLATEIMQLCFETYDRCCINMQECLSDTTFQVLLKGTTVNYEQFSNEARNRMKHLLSDLFIKEWTQNEQKWKNESDIIHHFLSWPIFMLYLKAYDHEGVLTVECLVNVTKVVSVIEMFTSSLLSGEITMEQLARIQQTHNSFPEAAALVLSDVTYTYLTNAIAVRQKEIEEFTTKYKLVTTLVNLCPNLENVDRTQVDEVLDNAHNMNAFRICDVCEPVNITDVQDNDKFQPKITAFQLSDSVNDMLPHLSACFDSSLFMKMWEKQCRTQTNECFTFDDVEEKVWHHVKRRWDSLADDIRSGSIQFSQFEKLFGQHYDDNYELLAREIEILGISQETIDIRIAQLQQYNQLESCALGAKTIIRFAHEYALTGDFSKIQAIAKHSEHDPEMRDFDPNIMKTCQVLKDITRVKEECLAIFLKCRPLIDWLKSTMKMGLKELKVFVDLAFMSVAEEPMQIRQVQCFHSSVTGYAPLIFDLKRSCDYKQLLELCQNVWNELHSNPKLPHQLKDTMAKLVWLKEIQKSLGSVELTSLMQANAINSAGIYKVGRHAFDSDRPRATQLDVQDMVRLTVSEGGETKQTRSYTVSQLQDLQSRLMLVAGKSGKHDDEKENDSVERFTMIFDSVTRLAKVCQQLASSGCVLFNDFTATFFCHPKRHVCAILEFGRSKTAPHLQGRLFDEEDVKDYIPELASFLELCLKEWLQNIREKRESYLHLNYFNVDQLVILQRELVKLGTEEDPSCRIYPLLSAVKLDCTQDDLLQAREAAKEEIDSEVTDQDNDELISNVAENDVEDNDQTKTFITELEEAGFEYDLAVLALQNVDPNDIDEAIVWCMNYEESKHDDSATNDTDEDITETVRTPVDTWNQSQINIQSLITTNVMDVRKHRMQAKNEGLASLMKQLEDLWRQFLGSITSDISDFINLEHLGIILKHLAAKDTRQLSRNLQPGLREDQPNLILCPCDDVLLTTISLYLHKKDQPLPQSDEVLLCTTTTTKDEVDIFLRRAKHDSHHKIHCLVNAECLKYDVSELAERCLEQYMQETRHEGMPFRLVVICGSENECRSTFISSLDKYKRQPLPVHVKTIREILSGKLTVDHNAGTNITHAAWVDKDHLSVRVIKSHRPGVGKTLYKQRREEDLGRLNGHNGVVAVSIPLQENNVDMHYVTGRFLEHTLGPDDLSARLFHVDIAHAVLYGVDNLLFNLLILGCLTDKTGWVWRKSPMDLYLIEAWPLTDTTRQRDQEMHYVHRMLSFLPDTICRSPAESLQVYTTIKNKRTRNQVQDQLFDEQLFVSEEFQRPFQYLYHLENDYPLDDINRNSPLQPIANPKECLHVLLRHCGMSDPSWLELHHFVWFLNTQLVDFENSSFTGPAAAEHLPGFSTFVLRFLIQMSKDFATRSLNMSEESPGHRNIDLDDTDNTEAAVAEGIHGAEGDDVENTNIHDELKPYQLRRTWESSPHPYLFFNSDRSTFTFLGFYIERGTGNLIDTQTKTVLVERIIDNKLSKALYDNKVPITENFDDLPRHEKILKLCSVMGIDMPHDPDDSYELTTDNVKKMFAIYMRFRCGIPVIIMGETGCGKTRLIKFMCALQVPPGANISNMVLVKVHGGTTKEDIERSVRRADKKARKNASTGQTMYTVLFFDEANTSDAIGLIKEIMCDKTLSGKKLHLCESLKIVAACNPYRKHSDELIKKLEQAGLGYHVDADDTTDRLGRVPMRRLVYRVQPLPQSMLPLVWDFGQLNTQVEDLYIRQMVRRYIRQDDLPDIPGLIEVVSAVLTASQAFMRRCNNECSFVSLRDVDRVLSVMSWFYLQSRCQRTLYNLMDIKLYGDSESSSSEDEETIVDAPQIAPVTDVTRSLILALGVCYHACLRSRDQYCEFISNYFGGPCKLPDGGDQIQSEIECCQDVFLEKLELDKNIARNMALKENVFMMVVCIELRIPLFLVGKPGSSKSLAKTIVADAMQGNKAKEDLFKQLKQAQMISFQCSPLSTPDGIVGTFRQCAQFQKDKDLKNYVSVVVLDEVGLAEDSPRMPLKTLHPLLEDGCQGDETPEAHKKVAFIGISNWALDPAKMNRGILVQRDVPDMEELVRSARGICRVNKQIDKKMEPLIEPMAEAYLELFDKASQEMREFFGLRDFYSLVKMVCGFVEKSKKRPTWHEMLHAIKRNFGGLDKVDSESCFRKYLAKVIPQEKRKQTDPECTPDGLIRACLFDTNKLNSESRYLLLLMENYGALTVMQQIIQARRRDFRPITIFGSSFRCDQEYTQVCRNINKIKVCMETGNTVVLLNLENLYESLYDALNQYYVYCVGERFVDLGLGTHRVKCPVHKKFRLIVVAEKNTVYKKFPIPLINRLEKHVLTVNTMLSAQQQRMVDELKTWTHLFTTKTDSHIMQQRHRSGNDSRVRVSDTFIGYNDDTCSAVVLNVWEKHSTDNIDTYKKVLTDAKMVLLWCSTPNAVANLKITKLSLEEQKFLNDAYFNNQAHGSLVEYLQQTIVLEKPKAPLYAQITTHSKLMSSVNKEEISQATCIPVNNILFLESLSSFDTEQQFSIRVRHYLQTARISQGLMVIQCNSGDINANLVACARYCIMDELEKLIEDQEAHVHIVFIIQLPRQSTFSGFQCGYWRSLHIDDLYPEEEGMPRMAQMVGKSVATLVSDIVASKELDRECDKQSDIQEQGGVLQSMTADNDVTTATMSHFHGMIKHSVHAALAIVKDKEENTTRGTDRVKLVLQLLHANEDAVTTPFVHGICCLLAKLLNEKESKTFNPHAARDWVIKEAATDESLNKTGTYRRSCLQTLQNKVAPVLAAIIAFLDTNDNLKLLQGEDAEWKSELWLDFLGNQEALQLQYSDMQSAVGRSELTEVTINTTGCENHIFCAQFPFSWIVIEKIKEILALPTPFVEDEYSEDEEDSTPVDNHVVNVLNSTPIGQLLNKITDEETVRIAVQEYVHDFVHTVYSAVSEQEHQLVCQSIVYHTSLQKHETGTGTLIERLVRVHEAHTILAQRFLYFGEINKIWRECSSVIEETKENEPDNFMFKEEEYTFPGLYLMIESLTPTGKELNNTRDRMVWLNKVHRFRPIVEKLIHFHQKDPDLYGAQSYQCMQRSMCLWNRVLVVKLFLEHVCVSDKEDRITIKYCMPLWKFLGEETDMKQLKSVKGLETFLKTCNKQARAQYLGPEVNCSHCENKLEGAPIVLPCKDAICNQCYMIIRALRDNKCQTCRQTFVKDWIPLPDSSSRMSQDKLKDYQRRCNSFFMDVVSQLCFADNTAPSREVVEHILGYIFFTMRDGKQQCTRDMSVLDTGIDPSPVFRSFLLQLLLKTSEDHVTEYLKCYLHVANEFVAQESNDRTRTEQILELNLLVIQCIENKLLQDCKGGDMTDTHEAQCALEALRGAEDHINTDELNVDKMYAVARARMGLSVAAKYIAYVIRSDINPRQATPEMRRVIDAAWKLYDESKLEWTRIYLVKYLCRRYGIDTYHRACKSTVPYMRWIALKTNNEEQVVEVTDRYIVCGERYRRVREVLTQVLLGENIDHLTNVIQELEAFGDDDKNDAERLFGLAIHREISSTYLYPIQKRKLTPQIMEAIQSFIEQCDQIDNKELFINLITNQLSPRRLLVTEREDQHLQGMQCLLVHYMLVMTTLDTDGETLLQPLLSLVHTSESCDDMYLPTMPQDDLETVKEALLNARPRDGNENPVFYHCPNGHLYVIGDCGRPGRVGVCQECGAAIGGERHRLLQGNIKNEGDDQTANGHILGTAEDRGLGPNPERRMTPSYCATVRLFLHLAMYAGCGTNEEGVLALIKPTINALDLERFLWDHIQLDIEDLHRGLGRSTDDVLLLMHLVLNNISSPLYDAGIVGEEMRQLSSKRGREEWEARFCSSILEPVFKDLDGVLKEHNQQLAEDRRLGADPLLCLLYETESDSSENADTTHIQNIPRVWRYCTPISWEHLKQQVYTMIGTETGTPQQHKVLKLFIEEEHFLKALRFIPSILRLHRALLHRYQRKLDKQEALQITVASILKDAVAGDNTDMLIQAFTDAWDIVRSHIKINVCYTKYGGVVVHEKYCTQRITPATPISLLLPTTRDAGLCSYALLDFLMRKHNQFLDRYCKETRRKASSLTSVSPMEVTSAHLISYDPEHDILPLVLANCQYSFEMGKGTKIEYDFPGLERQIMDRFLLSKSRIDVGSVLQIDQMVYRTELTDSEVFSKLDEKIQQENLEPAVRLRINEDLRSLPDICKTLDNVDIAISFLKSTGGKQDNNLHNYMVDVLKMSQDCNYSPTAKQVCEFKHCKTLWLLLSLLKAKQMANLQHHSEAIFETVSKEFHDDLPEDVLTELQEYVETLSLNNLSHLVEVIHEFILLKVAVRENTNDEEFEDSTHFKFGEYLYGYVDSLDNPTLNMRILEEFPTEILYKHCTHTWITLCRELRNRQQVLKN